MLDAIGAGQSPRIGDRDWAEIFAESPELANAKDRISQIKSERLSVVDRRAQEDEREYATPLLHQLKVVQKRTNLAFYRSPNYG